jgi:hypothetical protein
MKDFQYQAYINYRDNFHFFRRLTFITIDFISYSFMAVAVALIPGKPYIEHALSIYPEIMI